MDVDYFHANGVGIVKNFATPEECKGMMDQMAKLIKGWDPKKSVEFSTNKDQEKTQGKSNYFLDSAEGIGFFMDKGGLELLKSGKRRGKAELLNKVGHDLHSKDPVFKKYSTGKKVA